MARGVRPARGSAGSSTLFLVLLAAVVIVLVWRLGGAMPGAIARAQASTASPAGPTTTQDTAPSASRPAAPAAPLRAAPGTAGLSSALTQAFTQARAGARDEGVSVRINSGRRSVAQQQALFDKAVEKYGSAQEAARWVLPPDRSAHVAGNAIDVTPAAGATWLGTHGSRWGLCQRYANEPWHFELLTTPGASCPAVVADATAG